MPGPTGLSDMGLRKAARQALLAACWAVCGLTLASPASAQAMGPKYEVRAAWVTTLYALDWPKTKATSPETTRRQQEELCDLLDRLKAAGINTVLFQTRSRGDVSYPSRIEPFSTVFTGQPAGNPGYDPLAFAVEQCHRRGMEIHAWMVAIPVGNAKHARALGRLSVTRKQPAICMTYRGVNLLNPAHPKTREYLASLVCEVVERYDVDGIHLDYLRYPEHAARFPDGAEYRRSGRDRSLAQWRRDNITAIVRHIYREVKVRKPWVKVSTCPVGRLHDTDRYPAGGWNALDAVYQDAAAWLSEGIQDQIYPMMYYSGNFFYPFALDWAEHAAGRQVVPGLGIYCLDAKEGNWPLSEVERQIRFTRKAIARGQNGPKEGGKLKEDDKPRGNGEFSGGGEMMNRGGEMNRGDKPNGGGEPYDEGPGTKGLAGQGHYRAEFLVNNTKGLYDLLQSDLYSTPALVPPMTWLDSIPPTAPTGLTVTRLADGYLRLTWQPSTDNDSRTQPTYVVYGNRSPQGPDTNDPRCILAAGLRETSYIYAPDLPWQECSSFAVTAVDRYGNESLPSDTKSPR